MTCCAVITILSFKEEWWNNYISLTHQIKTQIKGSGLMTVYLLNFCCLFDFKHLTLNAITSISHCILPHCLHCQDSWQGYQKSGFHIYRCHKLFQFRLILISVESQLLKYQISTTKFTRSEQYCRHTEHHQRQYGLLLYCDFSISNMHISHSYSIYWIWGWNRWD